MTTATIRVELPFHLQTLACTAPEVCLKIAAPVNASSVLDALEARYLMLRGTVRDHVTKQRRPFLRYFGCQQDLSHESVDATLPPAICSGAEPFIIWGALSGG